MTGIILSGLQFHRFETVCRSATWFLPSVPPFLPTVGRVPFRRQSEQGTSGIQECTKAHRNICTYIEGSVSQDVSANILMTFLLLSVPPGLTNVELERVVEVLVESWTPSENDAPVPAANSSHILVDEWERGAATGRRPQP
jgi:hypothetical protein